MDNSGAVFDLLMLGIGVYLFYVWYLLKVKGVVKEEVLLSKAYPYKRCKDKDGYREYMSKRLLIVAVACILVSLLGLANLYLNIQSDYSFITTAVFLVVIIWFARIISKAYKKFW